MVIIRIFDDGRLTNRGPNDTLVYRDRENNTKRKQKMTFITSDTFKTKANRAVPKNFKAPGKTGSLGWTIVKYWIGFSIVSSVVRNIIVPMMG